MGEGCIGENQIKMGQINGGYDSLFKTRPVPVPGFLNLKNGHGSGVLTRVFSVLYPYPKRNSPVISRTRAT